MNTTDIIDLHKKYKDVYEGYTLRGSYKLYLPYYKIDIGVSYLTEIQLNVLEEYICKCISLGVNLKDEICYSMGIKEDIFDYCTQELVKENYLCNTDEKYEFTKEGQKLFEKLHRNKEAKSSFEFYLNGINKEYYTIKGNDTEQLESERVFVTMDSISKDKDSIILTPRKIPTIDKKDFDILSSIMIQTYLKKEDRITDIKILDEKEITYSFYTLLVYFNEGRYKILACDNNYRIDTSITDILQNLYDNNKLIEFMQENDHSNNAFDLNNILKNYEKEVEIQETEVNVDDEEQLKQKEKIIIKKKIIKQIKEVVKEDNSLRYIMNYEIREKFRYYLENAKESLYIISPWMNNYIINNDFINSLEGLLKNGVKVRIIYGISSKEEINQDYRNKNTSEIANRLKKIAEPYGDLFRIEHGQTHEKLLICDRKYYINGSFNFLSYSGESTGKFRNEGSTYSENGNLINETIKLRFNE